MYITTSKKSRRTVNRAQRLEGYELTLGYVTILMVFSLVVGSLFYLMTINVWAGVTVATLLEGWLALKVYYQHRVRRSLWWGREMGTIIEVSDNVVRLWNSRREQYGRYRLQLENLPALAAQCKEVEDCLKLPGGTPDEKRHLIRLLGDEMTRVVLSAQASLPLPHDLDQFCDEEATAAPTDEDWGITPSEDHTAYARWCFEQAYAAALVTVTHR